MPLSFATRRRAMGVTLFRQWYEWGFHDNVWHDHDGAVAVRRVGLFIHVFRRNLGIYAHPGGDLRGGHRVRNGVAQRGKLQAELPCHRTSNAFCRLALRPLGRRRDRSQNLTLINYAFAGVADNLTCASLDTFADWGMSFAASESVDGIDIDWEYPGACGATCNFRADDTQNLTLLLKEFRDQLDAASPDRHLLLTAATPVAASYNDTIDLLAISAQLDWMNLMAYDFHGSWEPNGPTYHHTNLYRNPSDPSMPQLSVHAAVSGYLDNGVSAAKIAIGIPFFGHGWTRVPSPGLYQSAGGLPRGAWERGVDDYKVLMAKDCPQYWDPIVGASWLYNGSTFWSFDSPQAVRNKMHYIAATGLRGVMFWELSGDDGTLVAAIAGCLASSASCP